MKKFTFFVAFLFLLSSVLHSQNGWVRQDSLLVNGGILSIDFINENTGFFCGSNYNLYKTTNGGLNWIKSFVNDSSFYYQVFVLDNNNIFMTANGGNIFKSTNSGISWVKIPVTSYTIKSIFMNDANTGYIVTSSITPFLSTALKTTNGGSNWTTILNTSGSINYLSVFSTSQDTTYISGNDFIYKTINGGINWSSINFLINGFQPYFYTIKFVNSSTGFTSGYFIQIPNTINHPMIFRTTNSGLNWTGQKFTNFQSMQMRDLSFIDENNGCAVGDSGLILRTTNSGIKWTKQSKLYQSIYSVCYRGDNKITVGGIRGAVYATTNGGWSIPDAPALIYPNNNLQYVEINPIMNWQPVEYNASFYRLQISLDSNFSSTILDVNNIDSIAYQVPTNILNGNNTYFWRVNAGNTLYISSWSSVWKFNTNTPLPPTLYSPFNNDTSVIPTPQFVWTGSYSSLSYKTQISKDSIFSLIILDTNTGFSQFNIPYNKLLWNTSYFWKVRGYNTGGAGDWSEYWKFKTTVNRPTLIVPSNNDTGIMYNYLFDWDNYINATSYRFQISSDSLFANIICNYNLYSSQYRLTLNLNPNIFYYWRVNALTSNYTTFWSETRKFKTSILYTGIKQLSEIPKEYGFYNYPNPFNPFANIKFDIPQNDNVKIILFNSLGQKIINILDKKLSAGTYQLSIDASNLPSGVYFCKFISDNYNKTNKILLIK